MASFEEILNMPASDVKPPEAFPVGEYQCMVDGPPEPGKSSQKQTDFLRFRLKIIAPYKGVDPQQLAEQQVIGKTINAEFYITDDAKWRLKEFLENCGIDPEGKSLSQMVAEAPNRTVLVTIMHELSQDGKRKFHRVRSTARV